MGYDTGTSWKKIGKEEYKLATFTENYNLIKPDEADYYDVADFNENMDTLDAAMATVETEIDGISEKIGTPASEGDTLFSLLQNNQTAGLSVIKSLQHHLYEVPTGTKGGTISITEVDTTKCIVLFERLSNNTSSDIGVEYTLNATSIDLVHESTSTSGSLFGFWIIEFY